MAIDTTPSTVATNALQSIPFAAIIGGPLDAAIKAQAMAAQTSWEFIQNVGLTKDPQTGETKAISVNFQYQKDGRMVNLVVPLLAIVPIPFIAIDTITIDFTAKIDASASTFAEQTSSQEANIKAKASASIGWGPFSAKMSMEGGFSSKSSSKATQESKYSVEYTINIHCEAGQDSMPAGLAAVLNILNNAITEGNPGGTFDVSPTATSLSLGADTAPCVVSVKSRDSKDLAITEPVTFDVTLAAGVAATDVVITVPTGTKDASSTDTKIIVTPTSQGVAAIQIAVAEGAKPTLTAAEAGKVAVSQGGGTPTDVSVTFLPPTS